MGLSGRREHCRWCGAELPEDTRFCPRCGREWHAPGSRRPGSAKRRSDRRPKPLRLDSGDLDVERLQPAPGQEPIGSWANIRAILRHDPLFGAVIVMLAASAAWQVVRGSWTGAILAAAMLWGLVTFRWWGYLVVMIGAVMGLIFGIVLVAIARGSLHWALLLPVAINAFVVVVLFRRRDRFD
jgi:hypothetical protein